MQNLLSLLRKADAPQFEVDLTEDDLRPKPLEGPSIEHVLRLIETNIVKLTDRRDAIVEELDRLTGERQRTELVLGAQEEMLAKIRAGAPAPRMPQVAQLKKGAAGASS